MIPGVWSMGQFDATKKFLSSQYKNSIPVYTQCVTTALHLLLSWLFIDVFNGREIGAGIAMNITYILNMLIADYAIRKYKDTEF